MSITTIPNWQTLTPAELLSALQAVEFVPTNAAVTLATIRSLLPTEAYALVRLTLEAATVPQSESMVDKMAAAEIADAITAMRTVGLSLSSPDRQDVVDSLALSGGWPDAVRDVVKSLGGTYRPLWSAVGFASEPTEAEVEAAQAAALLAERRIEWRIRFDAALNQLGTSEHDEGVDALEAIAAEANGG